MNLLILWDWHAKRDRLDPWGEFLGEPPPPRHRHTALGRRTRKAHPTKGIREPKR